MAKLEPEITLIVKVTCSMWDALKFRMMGKDAKKELFDKMERVISTIESNPESSRLQ